MTAIEIEYSPAEKTQRLYARLAGFLFLWLIVTGVAGLVIESHVAGSGTFAETAKRISASEHLYRVALCTELIETMSALVLAFALYVTLMPVDKLLAQMAMYWRLGESFIGGVGVMFGFMTLHLYMSPEPAGRGTAGQSEALVDLLGHAGSNISAIFFSIGSTTFFCLFFKSRYIPRILSAFGVFASVVVTIILFGMLIFPEYAGPLQFGWAPMALAEVSTGIWLMLFSVKTQAYTDRQST
jgi:hypothetical protein